MHKIPSINDFKRKHYCAICSELYGSDATRASVCPACKARHTVNMVMESRKARHPEVMIGVGSGGNQKADKNHKYDENSEYHMHRHDVKGYTTSHYKEMAKRLWGPRCVLCGNMEAIHIHHINGIKSNNTPHNIVPLCERCHNGIHSKKRLTSEELLERFESLATPSVLDRLKNIEDLENDFGVIPDHELIYVGAEFIVKNNIDFCSIVSARRPNAKQDLLIKAMTKTSCKCEACGCDDKKLEMVFINGNRRDKRQENVTMLCKGCYNAIIGKYGTYENFKR